jgi:tetratricopeptide (TPR) repeat protein
VQRLTVDYATAALTLSDALKLYRVVGDQLGQADALSELGFVHRLAGDSDSAIASHKLALELYRKLGDAYGEAESLRTSAELFRRLGTVASSSRPRQPGPRAEVAQPSNRSSLRHA